MSSRKTFYQQALARGAMLILCLASVTWAQAVAQSVFRIQALYAEPGKPSVYEMAFTTRETLSPEAEFYFEFPPEFDLSQLQIAGSPEITGGFTITRERQKVLVKRSGLGHSVASGTLVRLRLGAIINPKNFENSTAVAMHVRASAQQTATAPAKQRVTFARTETRE